MRTVKLKRARRMACPLCTFLVGSIPFLGLAGKDFHIDRAELKHMQKETKLTIDHLQYYHYNKESIYTIDPEELLVSFMEELDYNRLFFLEQDREDIFLTFNRTLIDVYLRQGQLHPAFQIFKTYRRRALARLDWIFERLGSDFDFDTNKTFRPDRSEMDWPKDEAEANELWEKRLTFDLLQELLNDETLERASHKVARRYRRTRRYIEELESSDVQELFLSAFTRMYDPHSSFLSAESLDDFSISMRNSLVGIGALLRDEDGYCVIQELISGGPAEKSNQLHPGDKIIEVGQEGAEALDVIDMKLRKIVDKIRGKKGTKVFLTVIPASAADPSERRVVILVRDEIKLTENLARAEIFEVPVRGNRTAPFGVIELPSFYGSGIGGESDSSTTRDIEELIKKLNDVGIEGLVLDLSRNGGGLLSEAIDLTGLFIPKGPVVQVKDTTGQIRKDWDTNGKVVYEGPLVVLVSRRSASASEIVAGALQNHRRAIIVGDSATHGKGTVQAIFELDRSINQSLFRQRKSEKFGATKITIQKFYLPNGNSTQNKGVLSDIPIPSINEFLPIGESDLPNALVWDAIEPLDWNPKDTIVSSGVHIDAQLLDYLRILSDKREENLDEFAYLMRNIEWVKEKQDQEQFALNLGVRRAQRELDEKFKEDMDLLRKTLNEDRFAKREVLLDVSREKRQEHQVKLRNTRLPDGRARANEYYQKVFYYQAEEGAKIEEVWVENIDYEMALKKSYAITAFLSEKSGIGVDDSAVSSLLQYLKTAETSDEFNVENAFRTTLGDSLDDEAIGKLIPQFFIKLIALDTEVLDDHRTINIPLRESLRILADWVYYDENNLQRSIAATHAASSG